MYLYMYVCMYLCVWHGQAACENLCVCVDGEVGLSLGGGAGGGRPGQRGQVSAGRGVRDHPHHHAGAPVQRGGGRGGLRRHRIHGGQPAQRLRGQVRARGGMRGRRQVSFTLAGCLPSYPNLAVSMCAVCSRSTASEPRWRPGPAPRWPLWRGCRGTALGSDQVGQGQGGCSLIAIHT